MKKSLVSRAIFVVVLTGSHFVQAMPDTISRGEVMLQTLEQQKQKETQSALNKESPRSCKHEKKCSQGVSSCCENNKEHQEQCHS